MANPRRKSPPRRRDEISLASEIMPDGRYGIVLSHGKTIRLMDVNDVTAHCREVIAAAVRAQHDAAVLKQLHHRVGIPLDAVGEVLERVRARRPELNVHATHPLGLVPGVTLAGKPFIELLVNGRKVGQWDPEDARNHALGCLELAAAVGLDNVYRDVLVEDIDLGDRAYGMVGELSKELTLYKVMPYQDPTR